MAPKKSKKLAKQSPEARLEKVRQLQFKARKYRAIGFGLLIVACGIMGILYNGISGGNFTVFFENPSALFIMLVPFIPAAIVGMIAGSLNKKCEKLARECKLDIQALRKSGELRERTELYSQKGVK